LNNKKPQESETKNNIINTVVKRLPGKWCAEKVNNHNDYCKNERNGTSKNF
jgi:hypothetical protein